MNQESLIGTQLVVLPKVLLMELIYKLGVDSDLALNGAQATTAYELAGHARRSGYLDKLQAEIASIAPGVAKITTKSAFHQARKSVMERFDQSPLTTERPLRDPEFRDRLPTQDGTTPKTLILWELAGLIVAKDAQGQF